MKISSVEVIVQFCLDMEQSKAWYEDFLGVEAVAYGGGLFALAGTALHLAPGAPGTGRGGTGVYFHVDDVEAAYQALTARGYRFNEEPMTFRWATWGRSTIPMATSSAWKIARRADYRSRGNRFARSPDRRTLVSRKPTTRLPICLHVRERSPQNAPVGINRTTRPPKCALCMHAPFSPLMSGRWPHPGVRAHSGARACGAHPA
jgi:catechol 2,3-dioxygenase-like lactoylglutathione lyase family enzyme